MKNIDMGYKMWGVKLEIRDDGGAVIDGVAFGWYREREEGD